MMNRKNTRKHDRKGQFLWKLVAILSVVLLALLIAVVFVLPKQPSPEKADVPGEQIMPASSEPIEQPVLTEPTEPETTEPEATLSEAPVVEPEQPTEPITDVKVDTPYGELHYPVRWNGSVRIVTDQQADCYRVTFVGLIGEHEADLFAIVFGESTEMPIGTLVQADGTETTVRLNVDMFEADDSWSGEEIDLAYEMIADNTYVLENLATLENFR